MECIGIWRYAADSDATKIIVDQHRGGTKKKTDRLKNDDA
jgi:hypothetical protein